MKQAVFEHIYYKRGKNETGNKIKEKIFQNERT